MLYYKYSTFLKDKYGEKVYKIPVNVAGTCPNRIHGDEKSGCTFCGEKAAGFEMIHDSIPVQEQLKQNMDYIGSRYKAKKFIAYFQNYTGTYMPIQQFEKLMHEVNVPHVVGISISTRPDCISKPYLDVLKKMTSKGLDIEIELGLQSINNETLERINRGHTYECFLEAVKLIHSYGFSVGVHLIGNLPWDKGEDLILAAQSLSALNVESVKVHSLYILKNTLLGDAYLKGEFSMISSEEYIEQVIQFLRHLSPEIAIQRLFARAPESETLFCNWSSSWRKLQNQLEEKMQQEGWLQGDLL